MRFLHLLAILATLLLPSPTLAGGYGFRSVASRYGAGCVNLQQRIYCYGGYNSTGSPTNSFMSLDVSRDFTLVEGNVMWDRLEIKGRKYLPWYLSEEDYKPSANARFGFVPVNNQSSPYIIMQGGITEKPGRFTWAYHPDTNEWELLGTNGEPPNKSCDSTVTSTPEGLVVHWGGYVEVFRYYPSEVYILDTKAQNWTNTTVPKEISEIGSNQYMKGVTGQNGTIYYIGGVWANATLTYSNGTGEYNLLPNVMNNIIAYNPRSNTWQRHTTTGTTLPQSRKEFTLNLIPGTNNIIMYGGADLSVGKPVEDYVYILDTTKWEWIRKEDPQGMGPGPLASHNAVLVGHNSLFILFGKDINGIARGEFHILDLDYWAWQGSFSLSHQNNVSLPTPTDPPEYDRHLAAGSIAAIVLGCVAAACIMAWLALFLWRRKKYGKNNGYQRQSQGQSERSLHVGSDLASPHGAPPPYEEIYYEVRHAD